MRYTYNSIGYCSIVNDMHLLDYKTYVLASNNSHYGNMIFCFDTFRCLRCVNAADVRDYSSHNTSRLVSAHIVSTLLKMLLYHR